MMPGLMKNQSPGAAGTVTASGWANAEVFREYLQDHLMKYVQGRNSSEPILILYDGHRSHHSLDLIEWAKTNNIFLLVLPPHCSHILQPMDVGCFGPFQIKYSQECQTFTRCNGQMVSRYDVCGLACKAYSASLTPANLKAAFAKSGIVTVKTASEMISNLKPKIAPSQLYLPEDSEDAQQQLCNEQTNDNDTQKVMEEQHESTQHSNDFFQQLVKRWRKKRGGASVILSGEKQLQRMTPKKEWRNT